MEERRRYQRFAAPDGNQSDLCKINVAGESVKLVDFSLGGLCVLSKRPLSQGVTNISVEFPNGGKIELNGTIIRVERKEFRWRVAIDLTETFKLNSLRRL